MNTRTALLCISLLATSHIQAEEYYLEEFPDTAIENKADAAIRKYAARDGIWLSKKKRPGFGAPGRDVGAGDYLG